MTIKMVNMEFDGKAVSVPEGMTLVDAAATVGIHIPNLCHIKELRGVGACRMCMVEIEGMKTPVTGCTTRSKEGMKVQTRTPKVEEIRKFVTDLVLSFHPLDCMTCPKAGACDLQRYAAALGIRESSFGRKSFNYELNDKSPFITIDNNYCILCGRCVRVCKEQGTNVLDFMGRGITTKVSTALDKPLHESGCTFCGTCVEACPVNTIMERDRWQHGREWDLEKTDSVCTACGSGCSVVVSKKDGRIVKVNTKEDNGYICVIGRFGFDSLKSANRITTPMKKEGGKLVQTSWEDASKIAAEALKKAGADAGFIAAGSLTNEEAMAIQTLARDVVGSANIDTPASEYAGGAIAALRAVYGEGGLAIASQADMKAADCIVAIGVDPSQKQQTLQEIDVMIRRRAQAGAKIIIINPDKAGLTTHPNAIHLELKPGTDAALLAGMMSAALAEGLTTSQKGVDELKKSIITPDEASKISNVPAEKISEAAKAYAASKQTVVMFGSGISSNEDASLQALNLALLKNAGVIPVMLEANTIGVMQMGCISDREPGFVKTTKAGKAYNRMKTGMSALFIAGSIPAMDFKSDFVIALASHTSSVTDKADLVLPIVSLYEKQGTIINTYGIQKTFAQAQPGAGEAKDCAEIALEISSAIRKPGALKAKDIASLVKKAKAGKIGAGTLNPVKAAGANPYGVSGALLLMGMNQSMLAGSEVLKVVDVRQPVAPR